MPSISHVCFEVNQSIYQCLCQLLFAFNAHLISSSGSEYLTLFVNEFYSAVFCRSGSVLAKPGFHIFWPWFIILMLYLDVLNLICNYAISLSRITSSKLYHHCVISIKKSHKTNSDCLLLFDHWCAWKAKAGSASERSIVFHGLLSYCYSVVWWQWEIWFFCLIICCYNDCNG